MVSISITENTSLKDVFIELARLTDVDIQIDPNINTSTILKISNKPLEVVIKTICENANLKYSYENNILKIERDSLYLGISISLKSSLSIKQILRRSTQDK